MSSGLAKRASANVAETPKSASSSAAFRHSPSRAPRERSATSRPCADDPAFADRERPRRLPGRARRAFAARIADRRGTVVDGGRRRDHVGEFCLVRRRHDDESRQTGEIGDVERAGVGRPVRADKPARSMAKRTGNDCSATSWTT